MSRIVLPFIISIDGSMLSVRLRYKSDSLTLAYIRRQSISITAQRITSDNIDITLTSLHLTSSHRVVLPWHGCCVHGDMWCMGCSIIDVLQGSPSPSVLDRSRCNHMFVCTSVCLFVCVYVCMDAFSYLNECILMLGETTAWYLFKILFSTLRHLKFKAIKPNTIQLITNSTIYTTCHSPCRHAWDGVLIWRHAISWRTWWSLHSVNDHCAIVGCLSQDSCKTSDSHCFIGLRHCQVCFHLAWGFILFCCCCCYFILALFYLGLIGFTVRGHCDPIIIDAFFELSSTTLSCHQK